MARRSKPPPDDHRGEVPFSAESTLALPQEETDGYELLPSFTLEVTDGPDRGATLSASGDGVVIGTHESARLVVHDPTVSRFHCEITATGRPRVRDLGSRNGTAVDGVLVQDAYLKLGSVLTLGRTTLRFDLAAAQATPVATRTSFGLMVGTSPAMRRVFAALALAADSDSTVLLTGETGTGKEAAAESLHREGPRRNAPFGVVDCGAIPADLLESELFGHERGAFTGAHETRVGAFAAAAGGTIFLDEIGELPLALQPKLLRVLERREVKSVGSSRHVPVDLRVIAATNRDLRAEVNAHRFRSDLYYRLAVLEVRLPPVRDCISDLPVLVEHFLAALGHGKDDPSAALLRTPGFRTEIARHSWPGNVREVRNYVERCLAFQERQSLAPPKPAPAGVEADASRPLREVRDEWLRRVERQYLGAILQEQGGNVAATARAAGIDRIHCYRLLWRHGLRV